MDEENCQDRQDTKEINGLTLGFVWVYSGSMTQRIKAPVSVRLAFNHTLRKVYPETVVWEGKEYRIRKIGFHHCYRQGRTLFHVFSVASENVFFRLVMNTDNLFWEMEEISDGEAN